MICNRLFILQI